MSLDRVKLAKTLALTASPVDGEALASARAANRLVTAAGLTWQDVLLSDALRPDGSPRDAIPDPPVHMPDGSELRPPYGVRWFDTILWLMQQKRAPRRDEPVDVWLAGLPHRIRKRGHILPKEAVALSAMAASYVPRRPAA